MKVAEPVLTIVQVYVLYPEGAPVVGADTLQYSVTAAPSMVIFAL